MHCKASKNGKTHYRFYHNSTALGTFDIEDQTEKRSATQTPKMTSQQLRPADRNLGVAPNRSLWSDFRYPKLQIAPFRSHQLHIRPEKKRPWNPSTKTPSCVISTTSLLEALALAAILTWQGWCVDETKRQTFEWIFQVTKLLTKPVFEYLVPYGVYFSDQFILCSHSFQFVHRLITPVLSLVLRISQFCCFLQPDLTNVAHQQYPLISVDILIYCKCLQGGVGCARIHLDVPNLPLGCLPPLSWSCGRQVWTSSCLTFPHIYCDPTTIHCRIFAWIWKMCHILSSVTWNHEVKGVINQLTQTVASYVAMKHLDGSFIT